MTDRARIWLKALTDATELSHAIEEHGVLACDAVLEDLPVRYIAVVDDPQNPFPRARHGEVGLLQAWTLAARINELFDSSEHRSRSLISLVDVPSQAYGRREEALCLSLALAAAVDAYATARRKGHRSVALLLGRAFSGAFLAHGYQASRLLALDVADVQIQAMGKRAAARVTRRTVAELEQAAAGTLPMAYDLDSFAQLGILDERISCAVPDAPLAADAGRVRARLAAALRSAAEDGVDLQPRLDRGGTGVCRELSRRVRQTMEESWNLAQPGL